MSRKNSRQPSTQPETVKPEAPQTVVVDLGLPEVVDFEKLGYMSSRPEVVLSPEARRAVKRLALTLDQEEARLNDGTLVRGHASKTIAWLCERLADATS